MRQQLQPRNWLLTICVATSLFACNGKKTDNKETKPDSESKTQPAANETPQPPARPTVPFNAIVVKHAVADYAKWRPMFDADSTARKDAGMHVIGVSRGIDNDKEINIPMMIDDVAKAKEFAGNPRLKELMKNAGVTGAPDIKFINVLRMSEAIQKPGDYLEVSHKVKDFDAWLKAFDGEGPATRANDGLTDGVLARGIDDPNMVYLVFAISDITKARAALSNPARQKLMQDAGVVGKPEVFFGRDVQ